MDNFSPATLLSTVSIIIAITSLIIGLLSRNTDLFAAKSKKYHETIEQLYIMMLEIYTYEGEQRQQKIISFLDNLYSKNINTSLILQEHLYFLELKKMHNSKTDFNEIEISFNILANNIEELYWRNYEVNYYIVIQSDSWINESKKKLLLGFSNSLYGFERTIGNLIYIFPIFIVAAIINIFFVMFGYEIYLLQLTMLITMLLFFAYIIFSIIIVFVKIWIGKSMKRNFIPINGDSYIRSQIKNQKHLNGGIYAK